MALAAGTRLGSYEITGPLGVGGMGEVYRATDTKLGRDVAIKTLPMAFAKDTDRLARFEREAKLLAALNHAHIAAIYGLDEHEGTQYLAMELVEGETLEEQLKKGPLPVEDALRLALQIAEALEAAHEKGVVHRDLKPANVMVTAGGQVKVLDFGLAKAFSGDPNQTALAHSPALSLAMTQQGLILGTAGYMSPEQASGQATDQRADIWAFGVVLYEMLTGLPLFSGESVPHILAAVLQTEPDWKRLPKNLHPRLRQLLERCLEKKVRNRYHSIADVRVDIEKVLSDPQGVAPRADVPAGGPVRSSTSRIAVPVAAALVLGLLVAGLSVWTVMRPSVPSLARFDMTPDGGLLVTQYSPSAVVSPDGRSIAYLAGGRSNVGADELRLRRLDQLGSTALVETAGREYIASPFFSPDGAQIGFYTNPNPTVLKRVSIEGGPASTIAKLFGSLRGTSWGRDGTIVYGTSDTASGLWRVRATGGEPEMLTKPDASQGEVNHWWPEILPNGQAVLFTIVGASEEDSKIAVLSLATGQQQVLLRGGVSPHYSPTGHVLFGRGGTLFAVGFDARRLQIEGEPVPVQEGVVTKADLGATEASLASNGTLVYLSGGTQAEGVERHLVWVDTEGRETPVPTPPRAYDGVILSPDGTHAALTIEGDKAIWLSDLGRGTLERLPADLGDQEPSVLFFSPDGQRVASTAVRDGRQAVVWQAIDGTGAAESLIAFDASVQRVVYAALSPDGMWIAPSVSRGSQPDLGVVAVGDPKSYRDFLATPAAEFGAAISPDGHWIAYASTDAGDPQVYVQRFPEGGGRLAVSVGGGVFPQWSADGNALTYVRMDKRQRVAMARVPVTGLQGPKASPTFGASKDLFSWKNNNNSDPAMAPSGERFLLIVADAQGAKTDNRLILVQNWSDELKRLVPTK
jgi:Tol biopolymer transport system component